MVHGETAECKNQFAPDIDKTPLPLIFGLKTDERQL
jgi:hypothetical protein